MTLGSRTLLKVSIVTFWARFLSSGVSTDDCKLADGTCNDGSEEASLLQVHENKGEIQADEVENRPCRRHSALLVVDMQNDFMDDFPNATLGVTGASSIVPAVNKLIRQPGWEQIFFTTDFHPANHISFAHNSPYNVEVFDIIDVGYDDQYRICGEEYLDIYHQSARKCMEYARFAFKQELWPAHCVQGTKGAHIDSRVKVPAKGTIIRKGISTVIDSYGAFTNNVGANSKNPQVWKDVTENPMGVMLKQNRVKTVFIVGLAFDYCVFNTALQAAERGFTTYVITDATKAVFPDSIDWIVKELTRNGVKLITLEQYWKGHY